MGFIIGLLLAVSVGANGFLCWFIYRSLVRQSDLVALIEDLEYKLDYFKQHLEGVYELPMYFGEPTIQNLIEHSRLLLRSFDRFNSDYQVFNGEDLNELQETEQVEGRSS